MNVKKSNVQIPQRGTIPTQNRFQVLEENSNERDMDLEEQSNGDSTIESEVEESNAANQSQSKKPKAPPPIVLHAKPSDHAKFAETIKAKVKNGFHLKYTSERTNLYLHDEGEWSNYVKALESENIKFHTFTNKNGKTHAFVLKGLHKDVTTEEIKSELTMNYNIKVVQCYRMQSNYSPLYMVVTDSATTLKQLINEVRALSYTRVTWERVINKKRLTQCHRCQQWGHATSNCRGQPKCLKCAANHWTKECQKSPETPATCVNCNGPHPANSITCDVYKQRLKYVEDNRQKANNQVLNREPPSRENRNQYPEMRTRNSYRLEPAPPPLTNPWTNPQPSTSNQVPQQTTETNQITELSEALKELNSLVNMSAMLKAVKELNILLRNTTTPTEKFNVFLNFSQNINLYGI